MLDSNPKRRWGPSTEIKSFGELLGPDGLYRIPFLQRPFQWGVLQVGDMVGDLLAAFEGRYESYFLGHIIVILSDDGVAEIVDGQQRLTTFTILLGYIRDRLAAMEAADVAGEIQSHVLADNRPRLLLRQADAEFLYNFVQTPGYMEMISDDYSKRPAPFLPGTEAQGLIVQAAKQVRSQLDRLSATPLSEFTRFLLDRALVGYMRAGDRTDAAMIIRGMNMRGQQMSPADLIKLEAIGNSGMPLDLQERAARMWEEQEDALGAEDFAFLLEMLPLLASREATRRPGDLVEWRKHAFSRTDPPTLLTELLPHYAAIFRELLTGEVQPELDDKESLRAHADVNRRLKGLLMLQDRLWMAPAIAAVAANRARPKFLSEFFQGLERLTWACFLDAVRHENRPERYAAVVRAGADQTLLNFAFELKPNEVEKMWERLHAPFGRHLWRRRAIAFRANSALGGQAYESSADMTVEHVLPSALTKEWEAEGWKQRDATVCSDLLGNFALLPRHLNQLAGTRGFKKKVEIFLRSSPCPLTIQAASYREWTEAVVRQRTRVLAEALFLDWGVH